MRKFETGKKAGGHHAARRHVRRGSVAAAMSLLAFLIAPAPPAAANPIVEPVAADPSIVRAPDGAYYMYTTGDDWGDGRGLRGMSVFKSFDLTDWMYVDDVFSESPGWHPANNYVWAPHVIESDTGYSLYYALPDGANPCIGLATAPGPAGPWTDLGRPVFCAEDVGVQGTIDPFVWDDGTTKTMFVGNFKGVYAIPLAADGTAPAGEPVRVADERFEGPHVEYRDGYYYLFLSSGHCCNGADTAYRVLVGRSESLTGPYVDRKGDDLDGGGGALILAGSDPWAGPGHNTVVTDDAGDDWIVYHAIPRDDLQLPSGAQRREGMIDRIVWANGWPEIGDGSPSSTRPDVPRTDLPVRVSLTADTATTLPASGGVIEATMLVEAPGDAPYTGQVWGSAVRPNGEEGEPVLGPIDVDLAPGETREERIAFTVSDSAANGTYGLYAFAGTHGVETVEFGAVTARKSEGLSDVGDPLDVVTLRVRETAR
ncbi:family 43 glycosylhydrolase [Rhodococcus sp. DMU1]|uniref:family 43 glycosylhydrolase n=1 Tax=Rhodococcus sp. DMU1 TaxID=2722825 RepID=UPI00143E5C76|nr:family 43 glycosylhydrolase [Rhodococcus sp. DMU1]QIX48656.1 family 43 glycosylhydrolase [Rhodococcus sp. DMU1]